MLNKLKALLALCIVVCLLTACGSGNTDIAAGKSADNFYKASDEHVVYIEFDECYSPENIRVSLTSAENKNTSNEIPLEYYPHIKGTVLTLEEGAYCIRMNSNKEAHERYFIVDEEHSYYHIKFTSKTYSY